MEANAQCDVAEFNAILLENLREAFQFGSHVVKEDVHTNNNATNAVEKLFWCPRSLSRSQGTNNSLTRSEARAIVVELKSEILSLNLKSFAQTVDDANTEASKSIDKMGPFSEGSGKRRRLIDTLDHFCSWSPCTLADRGEHFRRIDFESLPCILTVHLPRVQWDRKQGQAVVDTNACHI